MANEHQAPRPWLLGVAGYILMAVVVVIVGVVGVIVGRSWDQDRSRTSQLTTGSEIILPTGGLLFKSGEGRLVAKLDADGGGGLLIIYNTSEKPIITIGGSTDGGGGLVGLTSGKGLGAVLQLAGNEEGGSVVLFSQKRGKRVLIFSADDNGGSIAVNGPTGDEAVTIDTDDLGPLINGRIEVLESRGGKILWRSPTGSRAKP